MAVADGQPAPNRQPVRTSPMVSEAQSAQVKVYPVENYLWGHKDQIQDGEVDVIRKFGRWRQRYEREGPRRSAYGVLLVWQHHHPHVLCLQRGGSQLMLPGGCVKPGEAEAAALSRKLNKYLAPAEKAETWDVGPHLGTFYRPNFDVFLYPYLPPHIRMPKEIRRIFLVRLPSRQSIGVPRNMRLVAAPLFSLQSAEYYFGNQMAAVPALLSRLQLNLMTNDDDLADMEAPGSQPVSVQDTGGQQPGKGTAEPNPDSGSGADKVSQKAASGKEQNATANIKNDDDVQPQPDKGGGIQTDEGDYVNERMEGVQEDEQQETGEQRLGNDAMP